MELDGLMHALGMIAQVFFLDLILSGDNALVIAVACRSLSPALMRKAVLWGTGFAIVLRVLLTTVVGFLLQVPLLKLLGAVLLISIAIKLLLGDEGEETRLDKLSDSSQLWSAISVVVMADLVLSLDNVVALAAAAQGSTLYLILGLLFSIPLLMYGSLLIVRLLAIYPLLLPFGASLLAWVAGQLAVSDPLLADWVNVQAPALQIVLPILCVAFVLVESRIIRERSARLSPIAPLNLFGGLMGKLSKLGEAGSTPDAAVVVASAVVAADPAQAVLPQPAQPVPPVSIPASASPESAAPVLSTGQPHAPSLSHALPQQQAERMDKEEAVLVSVVADSQPQASVEPMTSPAPTAPRASPSRSPRKDGLLSSPGLALLVKVLLGIAVLIGICAIGWLVFHLLSQGFLPKPLPSDKLKH